jgi:hypothetical protein
VSVDDTRRLAEISSMALPPKGDPQRPLHLAIRSGWILTGTFLVLAALSLLPLGSFANWRSVPRYWFGVIGFLWASGGVYAVFTRQLHCRRSSAITPLEVIAAVHGAAALVLAIRGISNVVTILWSLRNEGGPDRIAYLLAQAALIPLLPGLMILAFAQLIRNLCKSYEAIRLERGAEPRGFEPIMRPRPVEQERAEDRKWP